MTINFGEFELPPALEDAALEKLTGCPIHRAIDSRCTEPGCKNNGLTLSAELILSPEICERLRELGEAATPEGTRPLAAPSAPCSIFQTQPRMRCVL